MTDPYDKTTHDGKTVDWLTKAALMECEKRLGYPLTVVQGSYHQGVSASAGTHDGGGAVDLAPWDWENKVKVLRAVGFAAWHRPTLRGVWNEHIHAVLIGNEKLAPVAARQVDSYRNFRDGLAGNAVDNTWHPNPIPTFKWTSPDWTDMATEAEVQQAVADAIKAAIPDIAKAVLNAPVENRNPNGAHGPSSLRSMVTNIEVDEDRITKTLRALGDDVARLEATLKQAIEGKA